MTNQIGDEFIPRRLLFNTYSSVCLVVFRVAKSPDQGGRQAIAEGDRNSVNQMERMCWSFGKSDLSPSWGNWRLDPTIPSVALALTTLTLCNITSRLMAPSRKATGLRVMLKAR